MVLFILAYVGIFLDFLVFEEQFKLLRQCFFFWNRSIITFKEQVTVPAHLDIYCRNKCN